MADYQPVNEADLEPQAPPSAPPDSSPAPSTYEPVGEGDLAPAGGPAGPTGEFAYKGIPAAAAARFHASAPLASILGAAASKAADNYVNSFGSMNDADMKLMLANGYGDYSGPGALLQHAADSFNSGFSLIKNGIMAMGPAISGALAGAEGQFARETGEPEDVALSAEREGGGIGEAVQSDVGAFHGAAMLDAARANAAAPGIWGNAYRIDRTPEGDLTQVPLGRLPTDSTEAAAQSQTAADALHLPPETAGLIHKTYVQTGRPPAEVLMDAKTNAGGVLDDLVAGKVPTVYQGTPRAMTPEELGAAKGAGEPEPASQPVIGQPAASEPPAAPTGISKIGQSIEAKAVEDGLTKGFGQTAGYDKLTIEDQANRATSLINDNLDQARAIIRGEQPLPDGLRGTALITGMEEYIKKNPDADMAYELANSPLVSATSSAAQEMRLAAERTPDSATAKIQELRDAEVKQAGGTVEVTARQKAVKQALPEASGVLLPKEELSWERFLESIRCP